MEINKVPLINNTSNPQAILMFFAEDIIKLLVEKTNWY
jgi:hypothetical protein